MYPGALSEATEREKGIRAGFAWWKAAAKVVFYTDLGWSPGMHKAKQRANTMKMRIEERRLDKVGQGIFENHSCWKCHDGLNPCVQGPGGCEYPHARND